MLVCEKRKLEEIIQDILSGKDTPDLTLKIKGDEITPGIKERDRALEGSRFERRHAPVSVDEDALVGNPQKRLIRPDSRSIRDIWTIRYKDELVAKGQFRDLGGILTQIPARLLSKPRQVSRQVTWWLGLVSMAAVSFMAGVMMNRGTPVVPHAVTPQEYSRSFNQLDSTLRTILNRQEVLKTMMTTGYAQPKNGMSVPGKKEAPRQKSDFEARFMQESTDRDLRRLIELEEQRTTLAYKDKEFEQKGYLPTYVERQNINASLNVLNQQIGQIKEKYGIIDQE